MGWRMLIISADSQNTTVSTLVRDRGFLLLPVLPTVPGAHPPAAPPPTLCGPSSFTGTDTGSSRIGDSRCSFIGAGGGLWSAWWGRQKSWLMGHSDPWSRLPLTYKRFTVAGAAGWTEGENKCFTAHRASRSIKQLPGWYSDRYESGIPLT